MGHHRIKLIRHKNILTRLFNRYEGKCQYCGCQTTWVRGKNTQCFDNSATIEHIYSRQDIRHLLFKHTEKLTLACFKCNQQKNKEEQLTMFNNGMYFTKEDYSFPRLLIDLLNRDSDNTSLLLNRNFKSFNNQY